MEEIGLHYLEQRAAIAVQQPSKPGDLLLLTPEKNTPEKNIPEDQIIVSGGTQIIVFGGTLLSFSLYAGEEEEGILELGKKLIAQFGGVFLRNDPGDAEFQRLFDCRDEFIFLVPSQTAWDVYQAVTELYSVMVDNTSLLALKGIIYPIQGKDSPEFPILRWNTRTTREGYLWAEKSNNSEWVIEYPFKIVFPDGREEESVYFSGLLFRGWDSM